MRTRYTSSSQTNQKGDPLIAQSVDSNSSCVESQNGGPGRHLPR